jgi:integrase/recombinase XerD
MNKVIRLEPMRHRDADQVSIRYAADQEIDKVVRALPGRKWSQTQGTWYVPAAADVMQQLMARLSHLATIEIPGSGPAVILPPPIVNARIPLSEENASVINSLKLWMESKRYSPNTIASYIECLHVFCRFTNKPLQHNTRDDLVEFNTGYILRQHLSSSYQAHFVSAIKLLFNVCHFSQLSTGELMRPRREKRLPNVLSKEEVKRLLGATPNVKHRCMLSLIYSCGLRSGELRALEPAQINVERGIIVIRQAKGKKDRLVPLSRGITDLLKEYNKAYHPRRYLFEGQTEGEQYDERSLQNVLKSSVSRAQLGKPVTLHWLRHSYATHLLEAGTNLRYIQEILGHSNPKTTQIYTHVSTEAIQNIHSPFDSL